MRLIFCGEAWAHTLRPNHCLPALFLPLGDSATGIPLEPLRTSRQGLLNVNEGSCQGKDPLDLWLRTSPPAILGEGITEREAEVDGGKEITLLNLWAVLP